VPVQNHLFPSFLQAFKRYLDATTEDDDYLSEGTYKEFKDLAHRISSVYASFAKAQLRPVILKIVKGGMEYAFSNAPRTLPFLEGAIVQFAVKLEPADMRAL
jgi:cohesin complex subunit SA-1/2